MDPDHSLSGSSFVHAAQHSVEMIWTGPSALERCWANEAWRRFAGPQVPEGDGPDWLSAIHPGDLSAFRKACKALSDHGGKGIVEYRMLAGDGDYHWVRDSVCAVRSCDDVVVGFFGIVQPTQAERNLAADLQLRNEALNNALAGFDIVSEEGQLVYANETYAKMWGYDSVDEILGTSPAGHCADPDMPAAIIAQLKAKGEGLHEFTAKRKDGSHFEVLMATRMHRNDEGRESYFGTSLDITERRQLERELRRTQRMEAVGQLASGIAHDFNNLLTVISGAGDLLAERMPESDAAGKRYVGAIEEAARRAALLTAQLLSFGRQQVLQPQVLGLHDIVNGAIEMLERVIGEQIEIQTRLSASPDHVHVDRGQLEQVILNLAVNARDAMEDGGVLRVETENVVLLEEDRPLHQNVPAGSYVCLIVSDTGAGIAKDVQERIFEPFFTTKPAGRGTGLGLSTVYGIVRQSDGSISVYSEPGVGTTFRVYLPATRGACEHVAEQPLEPNALGGAETVLLVEDQQQVRTVIRLTLESLGYRVLEAANGATALELAGTSAPQLLLTDLVMPGMGGAELAGLLHEQVPELQVLFMSGYAADLPVGGKDRSGGQHFLQKPFTRRSLGRKLRQMLDGPPRP